MRVFTPLAVIALIIGVTESSRSPGGIAPTSNIEGSCGPLGSAHVRTTLYFGLSHQSGTVSEAEWQNFLRQQVTPKFPNGLTAWEADGQWKRADGSIGKERSKVLLLVHDESAAIRGDLAEIVESYKRTFQQQSVLWETAPVCAAF